MNKRLSHQQAKRIQQRQTQHITPTQGDNAMTQQPGLLIARYGNEVDIEILSGEIIRCNLRQHLGDPVVGDEIMWQVEGTGRGVITAINPRRSVLARPLENGMKKIIAANIDHILIVIAPLPKLIPTLLDSYLVIAESLSISPIIVLNKADLLSANDTDSKTLENFLNIYRQIGYRVLMTSTVAKNGLSKLAAQLAEHTHILVGQSGVGKSSLVSKLIPNIEIVANEISIKSAHGKHTTTTARLYHLQNGGALIDSPGIRSFGLWHMSSAELAQGFIEFHPYLGTCKFRNCLHLAENASDCAIAEATLAGKISSERLENYRRLVQELS